MKKKIIHCRPLWLGIFSLICVALAFAAFRQYEKDAHPPAIVKHTTTLTTENAQEVLTAGKPVYVEICTPDVCTMEEAQLEQVALKRTDVTFVTLDAKGQSQLTSMLLQQLAQANPQGAPPVAFPMHVVFDADGNAVSMDLGLLSAKQINQLVTTALAPPPAGTPITGGATANPSGSGASTVTPGK